MELFRRLGGGFGATGWALKKAAIRTGLKLLLVNDIVILAGIFIFIYITLYFLISLKL
jgi:hypothetical protein